MLAGFFLGPEFPSLLCALLGLGIVSAAARVGLLVPKQSWDFPPPKEWPIEWMGSLEMKLHEIGAHGPRRLHILLLAI